MSFFSSIGSSITGNLMNYFANKELAEDEQKYNLTNQQITNEANAANVAATNLSNQAMNDQNIALQKEFAQHGIRWKVDDAEAAGLHPLAALGASTLSYSPQTVGAATATAQQAAPLTHRRTEAFKNIGQDISRAVSTMKTPAEKEMELIKLSQEREILQNYRLKNQGLAQAHAETAMPGIDRNGIMTWNTSDYNPKNEENLGHTYFKSKIPIQQQQGVVSGTGGLEQYHVDKHGYLWPLLSQEAAEPLESDSFTQMKRFGSKAWRHAKRYWASTFDWRGKIDSKFMKEVQKNKPKYYVKPGEVLVWDRIMQMPRVVPRKGSKKWRYYHYK